MSSDPSIERTYQRPVHCLLVRRLCRMLGADMHCTLRAWAVLVIALCGSLDYVRSEAAPAGYQCKVEAELHVDHAGMLFPYPRPLALGKSFSIHRDSGQLMEDTASFWSPTNAKTEVLARGNRDNSFVVTYVAPSAGGGVHATLLQIQEFHPGPLKPFLLVSGGGIYSGVCK